MRRKIRHDIANAIRMWALAVEMDRRGDDELARDYHRLRREYTTDALIGLVPWAVALAALAGCCWLAVQAI